MNAHDALPSMRRTTIALAACFTLALLLALAGTLAEMGGLVVGLSLSAAAAFGVLGGAGVLTQMRQRRLDLGLADLFLVANASRSEAAIRDGTVPCWSAVRRAIARQVFGHSLMVGDTVEVKSLAAIRATLDSNSCLDGLPFMDEMSASCGRRMRVYRVVDKIYDYKRSRLMRRLDDGVLLVGLRCDGSAHAGCEAACYLIWKLDWLRPVQDRGSVHGPIDAQPVVLPTLPREQMSCQYTQLAAASRPMRARSLRGLLGPLAVGNVTLSAFAIATLTWCFNYLQGLRGGVAFPSMPAPSDDKTIRGEALQEGDWVRVKLPANLARAMDRQSKNRGLWFDQDMLKHCGQTYRVRGRIDKIIDATSGSMITMKTPCIALEGVHYSGEFQGFNEQHDFLYWREAWLDRIGDARTSIEPRDSSALM